MSFIHKNTVLVLNRNWQAISITTPAQAYGQMATDAATGLDIQHLDWMVPVDWAAWLTLPVRDQDISIGTVSGPVRAPTTPLRQKYLAPRRQQMPIQRTTTQAG